MIKYFILFLFAGISVQSSGQKNQSWLAVETDPMTTVFGAKTLSVVIEPERIKHWSLFLNGVSADFPNWVNDLLNPHNKDKKFDSKIALGGGFAVDYFMKPERKGYYIGLINLFFNNQVTGDNETKEVMSHNIIPRVGYRWYPFKKTDLYLNPFLGIRYEYLVKEQIIVGGEEFKAAGFGPFGTMHVGYHF